ncbi:VWA domain-containing protein [Candidatus Falkowbacteria bacterium]|jgi:hypothetical protein|nr:VWA domain-containing protein [Candidatus Falkowbacteria bacterium]MBT6574418.1 VWA domain-containing protein [Candidatus Falkowbacteria bacterium]MBT7348972.1 VWA domain-containing protein [Candidatus Falkowbacteria bacterium]MBT7500301.1 VWA domain-containing protein [Candidatus Falkowbacteria bacterium]
MSKPDIGTVKSVLGDAADHGIISLPSRDLMCVSLDDNVLMGCDGLDLDEIDATEVALVSLLIDDSSSMWDVVGAVIDGQNALIEALVDSKQKDSFLLGMWALNRDNPYHSYLKVVDAEKLDNKSYHPGGCTPLYDKWVETLSANVTYAQQLRDSGTTVRSIAVVITDGQDYGSRQHTAADCATLAKDLLDSETFVLAMVGLGNHGFKDVAKDMGIPAGAVLEAGDTPSDVRRVFQLVSQSVIRASQAKVNPKSAQNNFFTP